MARPKILVFQHVPFEPLGTLDPLLKKAACKIRYVNFGRDVAARPSLHGYAAIIVLGGPMNCDQIDAYPNLISEVEILGEAVDRNMSVLGICLGAQLLAKAVGGGVSRNAKREIGWYDVGLTEAGETDPVLSTFGRREQVFQWHEDGISLPADSIILATSAANDVQAFRHGDDAYGFQFHLEVNRTLIERWLTIPEHQNVLQEEHERIDPALIRAQSAQSIDALQDLSLRTFTRWIARFDTKPRRRTLPSR